MMVINKQIEQRIGDIASMENCTFEAAEQILRLTEPILFEVDD